MFYWSDDYLSQITLKFFAFDIHTNLIIFWLILFPYGMESLVLKFQPHSLHPL